MNKLFAVVVVVVVVAALAFVLGGAILAVGPGDGVTPPLCNGFGATSGTCPLANANGQFSGGFNCHGAGIAPGSAAPTP